MKFAFGAGEKRSEGFVHHDGVAYPGIDVVHQWSPDNPLPLKDGEVDECLLALDVLEHFSRRDVDSLVREFSRITAPGCAIIVCTIDIVRTARWILEVPGENLWQVEHLYCRQNFPGNRHHWAFTRVTLQDLLQRWGFIIGHFEDSKLHRGNVLAYGTRGPTGWKEFDNIARAEGLAQ